MAKDLALDKYNDWILDTSEFRIVEGGAEVAQRVRSELLFYKGEYQLNTNIGVDYFGQIFVSPANLNIAEVVLKTVILKTPGIASIVSFNIELVPDHVTNSSPRMLLVTFEAKDIYGNTIGATVNV